MVEFKVQLDESLVQKFGYKEIDKYLLEFMKGLAVKSATRDILDDLQHLDFENDKEWQLARDAAWQQEKHKYAPL
jgi:hypothetical protein